jgi:predicted nucleotidyltransferase
MTPGFEIIRVAEELEGLFGGRGVDLVTRRGLAQPLRDHVLSSARTLYGA